MMFSAASPHCISHDNCRDAMYCRIDLTSRCECKPSSMLDEASSLNHLIRSDALRVRASDCGGTWNPVPTQIDPVTKEVFNDASHPDYVGFNLTFIRNYCANPFESTFEAPRETTGDFTVTWSVGGARDWCAACFEASGGVEDVTPASNISDNVNSMQLIDGIALLLSSLILGLRMTAEIVDIEMCDIRRSKADDAAVSNGVKIGLAVLSSARRYCVMPLFAIAVPFTLLTMGGHTIV
eukprot:SAG31_NODE_1394_length_8528_cov_24.396251_3_plen_238_part_00